MTRARPALGAEGDRLPAMSLASPPVTGAPRALKVSAPVENLFGYYPGTVSVITAEHNGERNVMAAGWHIPLSAAPPLYGVALGRNRYTYRLVMESGAFALHFLPFDKARKVAAVGSTSRRGGADKFARFSLPTSRGAALPLPILNDAYLAYECRVNAVHETGDHDLVVGEVLAVHHHPEAFDELGLQNAAQIPAAVYYGRGVYEELGGGRRVQHLPGEFRETGGE